MPTAEWSLPIHRLAAEMKEGRITSERLVETFLSRIGALDGRLSAFVEVFAEEALAAGRWADARRRAGDVPGPLLGVPLVLKDLFEIEGKVCRGGSLTREGIVSRQTAHAVRKLLDAGMVVLGKTHTVEFAMGAWGTNKAVGTPRNPWKNEAHYLPGGSSSGSAVAVAAGMAPAGLGTDTGGSVRLPAGYCGVVGLKPTVGRIGVGGVLPLSPTLDSVGPITRSVEDAALLLDAMSGTDPSDPRTFARDATRTLAGLDRGVKGLRLAALADAEREGVADDVLAAHDRSIEQFERLGATVERLTLPHSFAAVAAHTFRFIGAEGYGSHRDVAEDPGSPLDPDVRERFLAGRGRTVADHMRDVEIASAMRQQFLAAMDGYDALLVPSAETAAFEVERIDHSSSPTRFTRLANLFGLCALSLPNGFSPEGLPTSLQIVGRPFEEALVLAVGRAYEHATEWHLRMPELGWAAA